MRRYFFAETAFLAIVLAALPLQTGLSKERPSNETGCISGTVISMDGGTVDGRVVVTDDSGYVAEAWVTRGETFLVEGLFPGTYFVQFFDFGEVPLCNRIPVEVAAGRTTRTTIELPISISGMPCEDMLEMGYRSYCATVDWAFGEFGEGADAFLSEYGMDVIAISYGRCREQANDEAMMKLTGEEREMVLEIREALALFDNAWWSVEMYGGSGAAHGANREYAGREDFIAELIDTIVNPPRVESRDVEWAEGIMEKVSTLPGHYEQYVDDYDYDASGYAEALNDFRDVCEELVDLSKRLPDELLVALAAHLEPGVIYYVFYAQ